MSDRSDKQTTMPLHVLPDAESWECRGCGLCCRGTVVALGKDDLARLAAQKWHEHPDFRNVKTTARESLFAGREVLAKRSDGSCVFLTAENRCRIHELHGEAAKPAVCRMFPMQLVPLEKSAILTPRRSCPTAAADDGPSLRGQLPELKRSGLFTAKKKLPPRIVRRERRSWADFTATAEVLQRLTCDERFPLVRRLVHGLQFAALVEDCQFKKLESQEFRELLPLLESAAGEAAGEYFGERQAPDRAAASLFRQAAVHYIRAHPGFAATNTWSERWRVMRTSLAFTRGRGAVPAIHPEFPPTTFDELERPLGPLDADIARPLNRFIETHTASRQYTIVNPGGRSLIESYRSLALTFPIALWTLRLAIGERPPEVVDMINIVVALERGRGMSAIARSANAMGQSRQLERLIAWYAR